MVCRDGRHDVLQQTHVCVHNCQKAPGAHSTSNSHARQDARLQLTQKDLTQSAPRTKTTPARPMCATVATDGQHCLLSSWKLRAAIRPGRPQRTGLCGLSGGGECARAHALQRRASPLLRRTAVEWIVPIADGLSVKRDLGFRHMRLPAHATRLGSARLGTVQRMLSECMIDSPASARAHL